MNSPFVPNSTLSKDINETINPAFAAKAMLQGASSLLVNAEHIPDPDGDIWAAREIIDATIAMVESIYTIADEKRLKVRAESLERGAA